MLFAMHLAGQGTRKRFLTDAIVRGIVSVAFLAGGWIYPGTFLKSDPIMRADADTRIGPVVLLCFIIGLIYAVMAIRSFCRACKLPS